MWEGARGCGDRLALMGGVCQGEMGAVTAGQTAPLHCVGSGVFHFWPCHLNRASEAN